MCQSVAEGGRRCPAHRHDSRAIIEMVRTREGEGGYSPTFYHNAFLDLRRQNRGAVLTDSQQENSQYLVNEAIGSLESPLDAHLADNVTLSSQASLLRSGVIDNYSDMMILTAVNAEDAATSRKIFSYVYNNVDNYPSPTPEQLEHAKNSLTNRLWISRVSRDSDAVKALALFQSGQLQEVNTGFERPDTPSVPRIPDLTRMFSRNSPLAAAGYDSETNGQGSRLELILRDDLDTKLTYQNVPESVWAEISAGGYRTARAIQSIRLNPDYRYESAEAAEAAGLSEEPSANENCPNCGQFVGTSPHACPAVRIRPEIYTAASLVAPEVEVQHEEVTIEDVNTTSNRDDSPTDSWPQTPEEMSYPDAAAILANMNYHQVEFAQTIDARFDRIYTGQFSNLYRNDKAVLIEQGLPADTHPDDLIVYMYNRDAVARSEGVTYTLLKVVPAADTVGMIYSRGKLYLRPQGRSLGQGQTWVDQYGGIPEGAIPIEQNTTASIEIAPVTCTANFSSSYVPYSYSEDTVLTVNDITGRGTKDRWRFGKARDIRRGLEAGETVLVPFEHLTQNGASRHTSHSFVDAQGWEVSPLPQYRGESAVAGQVALRKNANGVVEIVGVGSVHCSACSNSNCTHVGYSIRQSAYVAQGLLAPRESTGRATGVRRLPNPETGLPVSLENLCSVTRDDEGRRTVTFTSTGNSNRRMAGAQNRLAQLAENIDTTSTPEIYSMDTVAPNPTLLTRAFRNLEEGEQLVVPLSTDFRARTYSSLSTVHMSDYAGVTGNITYGRDETDGSVVVRERSLRCTCDVYRRNYSCRHTRRVEAGELALMASPEVQRGIQEANELMYTRAQTRVLMDAATVQDREEFLGRSITLEEAGALADRERNLTYSEAADINHEYRQEVINFEQAAQRREELAALAGYSAQREKMAARFADFQGPRYSEDYEAYEAEVAAVRAKIAAGEDPVTFERTSGVLNGIGDDTEHARKFGVEIEVVFPQRGNVSTQKEAVARALSSAGLASSRSVGSYHSGRSTGWAKWTAENDCTVDLEVVSPLMKDTPEDWAQLQKVCDIIKAQGGQADVSTGSHVHISTGDYGSSVESHAALLDEFSRYADVLYRLGSNPETKTHRGTSWCRPNVVTAGGGVSAADQRNYGITGRRAVSRYLSAPHASAINLEASGAGTKSHAEIRLWDGSISPAHIQMQVMLTAAMAEKAAQRSSRTEEDSFVYSPENEHMPLGTGKTARYTSKKEESAKFREMLDRYFPRESDRKRFIALWETTKWQS